MYVQEETRTSFGVSLEESKTTGVLFHVLSGERVGT
jgi:hypothetical protein